MPQYLGRREAIEDPEHRGEENPAKRGAMNAMKLASEVSPARNEIRGREKAEGGCGQHRGSKRRIKASDHERGQHGGHAARSGDQPAQVAV